MSCRIHIDSPGPFFPGTDIVGKLVCQFNDRTKVKGIKLRAFGDEHTEWMSSESYYNYTSKKYETRYVLFTGDNNLLSLESMLYGGGGESYLGPGTFSYPFSLRLPAHIPSTFENSYGYIRYSLKGVVDIPWAFDYEDKIYISVTPMIDLNLLPSSVHQPAQVSDQKTICCLCFASGPITMNVDVDTTAFTPGQNIHLVIAITNMSNVSINGVEAKLTQTFVSHVHSPNHETKHDTDTLSYDSWSGVGAHGENTYDVSLPIPANISVPNLDQSVLFEVSYGIEVTANVPGCHSDLDIAFTVYLGTIPLIRQTQSPNVLPYPSPAAPQDISVNYPSSQDQNGYPNKNIPPSNPGYPPSNPGYPGGPAPAYPPSNPGYPGGNGYPPSNPGYPGGAASQYPPSNPGYPGGSSGNQGYPGAGVPYSSATNAPTPSAPPPMYNDAAESATKEIPQAQNAKEKEILNPGGPPSAPPPEIPPPSYDDVQKK